MNQEFYIQNRANLAEKLPEGAVLLLFSGKPAHRSADAYHPFSPDRNFQYMAGLTRENLTLMLIKHGGQVRERLYIDPVNERYQKWIGRQITPEQAAVASGVADVRENTKLYTELNTELAAYGIQALCLDLFRYAYDDAPSFEQRLAGELRGKYPALALHDISRDIHQLRRIKQPGEIEHIRRAIAATDDGINSMMKHSRPGMFEYEYEAHFEYALKCQGVRRVAFDTILASGDSGCILHYGENNRQTQPGQLLLCDLGADWEGYCADITRTFPVSGQYTPRQAQLYGIVLEANKRAIAFAKPGVTSEQVNQTVKAYYAEALQEIGLIAEAAQVDRYYYHGCCHPIGLDVHDVGDRNAPLEPGMVVTIEPGLYVAEEEIGIRIEDDILITEDGCEVLSQAIMKEIDAIEAFMAR